ncbi:FAD-binding and (Fe-S)-binding domain-containing protein [Pseudidiomarina sp. CB1]|uniref:FAD-binding and (Fe-S)-binding domain-containing protein n=1 Tax=Pseudidiomarina sp. CB1 TaxID=2972484 RepID=UPI0021610C04|nr:FAD-binding and (Fe-S)-binding domain-containing protein [Pseudidiomarina sp. CB1]
MTATLDNFQRQLSKVIPAPRLLTKLSQRIAFSTDASFYHKVPKLVVQIATREEMQALLRLAQQYEVAVTFRAAGTSLSGQAISDSVLVLLTRDWQHGEVLEQGAKIKLQPGVIGAHANQKLAAYGRKIGPDPASINTCQIGGIAANNASGMCCGVKHNSYHTLDSISFVLADGTHVDTGNAASVAAFRKSHKKLLQALEELAEQVRANPQLSDTIATQFRLKNTMGYGLNALLDYHDGLDILAHLLIGSEGTLGFIADITYRTVAVPQASATGLYLFPDSHAACAVIPALKAIGVEAVELMDDRSLQSVQPLLAKLTPVTPPQGAVALLIEIGRDDHQTLQQALQQLEQRLTSFQALCPMSTDKTTGQALWQIRKGLFPAVGAVRERGTTVIIEDVAVPLEALPDAVIALQDLFDQHGYHEAIIFGHALDGNVHFVFTQGFETPQEKAQYAAFMDAVAKLITERFAGTLKAEHGTGRNMAPYLYAQWGGDGLAVMQRIKALVDPQGILNPGVILNDDPQAHLQDLKLMPPVNATVDACIECGFCEPQCPSLHYTLSPRQRIALMRRNANRSAAEQHAINNDFQHLGIDSCAATGLCATACPVGINTGAWVQELRAEQAQHQRTANWIAGHQQGVESIARFALTAARPLSKLQQKRPELPPAAQQLMTTSATAVHADKVIYFTTCPNRVFATAGQEPLAQVVQRLCAKAGIHLQVVEPKGHCCGQPYLSKGYPSQAEDKQQALRDYLWQLTEQGRYPVVFDASPCALQVHDLEGIQCYELAAFLQQCVASKLHMTPLTEPLMLHVTCSSRHLDQGQSLRALAVQCSTQVIEPEQIQCCGFAGDKGFSQPELNASALAPLAEQVPAHCKHAVSNSRTCEIGLSHHAGKAELSYRHIAYLLDELSSANEQTKELV